jgi:hypothetical protein
MNSYCFPFFGQDIFKIEDSPTHALMFQLFSQGPVGDKESLAQALIRFIEANADLQRDCLTYEPIWLEDVYARFKQVRP